MHYKVRYGGRVVSRDVYNILPINKEWEKELIRIYISKSEEANFWLSVLTDLKSRGVNDILIDCIGNLNGFYFGYGIAKIIYLTTKNISKK